MSELVGAVKPASPVPTPTRVSSICPKLVAMPDNAVATDQKAVATAMMRMRL
jgi:hypothetical protein